MNDQRDRPSPWWYRQRGLVLSAVYTIGFVLGNVSLDNQAQLPIFIAWGDRFANGNGRSILIWGAIVSALIAWVLRASGTAYLRRNVVFAADVQRDRLIVAGPFRFVRNPLYLGNMFLALAASVLAGPVGFFMIIAGNAVLGVLLAAEESQQLAQRYGAAHAAFRVAVPAFLPRLTPTTVPGSVAVKPMWRSAFLGEAFCLTFAVALLPIAFFGVAGLPAFWAIWVPALVLFLGFGWWVGRRNAADAVSVK